MATRIADTLGRMGEGTYPLVYAEDVNLNDGDNVQHYLDNLSTDVEASDVSYENEPYGDEDNVADWLGKMLDKIYYKAIAINNFTCIPSTTTFELGTKLDSVTFSWTLNKNEKSQSLTGCSIAVGDRGAKYSSSFNMDKTFTLTVNDGTTTVSSSKNFKFLPRIYWGSSALQTTYDSDWALKLTSAALKSGVAGTYEYNIATNEYGFIVLPSNFTFSGTVKIGGFDTELVFVDEISLINSSSYTQNYKIYRTGQKGLGNISIVAS